MKLHFKLVTVLFAIVAGSAPACKSTKTSAGQTVQSAAATEAPNVCDQTIRYYANKLKAPNNGQEITANTEILINPSAKLISVLAEPPGQSRVEFSTVIESADCNLNSGLTEGQVTYTGYTKRVDGSTTNETIKLEAKDGSITISSLDKENKPKMIVVVSKWELVKE